MNKKVVILIVIIVLVIVGLFVFNSFLKSKSGDNLPTLNQTQVQNTLDVPDQAGGQELFINSVSSRDGGFVAVYREENGAPGKFIGVSPFIQAGATMKNLRFALKEVVKEGEVLYVALNKDNGDGVFDPATDTIANDANGNPLRKRITILSQGSIDNEFKL